MLRENAEEMMDRYLVLNDDEETIQAAWEIDMEDIGRSAHESEIMEYRMAD